VGLVWSLWAQEFLLSAETILEQRKNLITKQTLGIQFMYVKYSAVAELKTNFEELNLLL
jgi:hypothetical protein